ncbi:nucleosome assembly protein 1-like 1 [Centruroides vittatus]|uniref:nucleosome assembly protein 1-like 1 n=1 Tax=Centruroides vittatus TaxID=120091 RepID=UPI00350F3CF0
MDQSTLKIEDWDNLKNHLAEKKTEPLGDAEALIENGILFPKLANVNMEVVERIEELRKLQLEYFHQEVKYFDESHDLDLKYAGITDPLFKMRKEIVNSDTNMLSKTEKPEEATVQGIPDFWLKVLLNSGIKSMIQEDDKDVLMYLKDICLKYKAANCRDFILEFHFKPNKYFRNTILTKEYEVKCCLNPTDPYYFEGPEIVKCTGCTIEWNENFNKTIKPVCKENGANVTEETATEKQSFFNFFGIFGHIEESDDQEFREFLSYDFEIGKYFKDRIIPRAVLYYIKDVEPESDWSSLESEDSSED